MKKIFAFVVMISILALSSMAQAWELPGETFGLGKKAVGQKFSVGQLSPAGETGVYTVPTASLGAGINIDSPASSYGLNIGYDLVLADISPIDANTVKMDPILGLGICAYGDFGPFINSKFNSAPIGKLGFNVIGPEFVGIVGEAAVIFDLNNGERTVTGNITAPFGPLLNELVHKVFGL